ncbi:MAG TPA: hypothetical protein VNJ29_03000 [Candidatus Nitrosotenuis sp.]|nr:hypothetical protein [Candidatus Nitrosotenuis sp.]
MFIRNRNKVNVLIVLIWSVYFIACNKVTDSNQPASGKPTFSTHKIDISTVPDTLRPDSLMTLTISCYPAMTGVGYSWIVMNAVTVLEYPRVDTIKTLTNVIVRGSFVAGIPFSQQWKFKMLGNVPTNLWVSEVRATFDSIYIADSLKMYPVSSKELEKIFGVTIDNSDAVGDISIPTKP